MNADKKECRWDREEDVTAILFAFVARENFIYEFGGIFFGFGMFSIFKILCYHGFNYIRLKAFEALQAPYAYALNG